MGGSTYTNIINTSVLILVFVFVVLLAYFAARIAGKFQNNIVNAKSNIRIIEYYRVGNNKFIAIAQIGNKYYSLGIGKDTINMISEIPEDEIKITSKEDGFKSFKDVLSGITSNKSNKINNNINIEDISNEDINSVSNNRNINNGYDRDNN